LIAEVPKQNKINSDNGKATLDIGHYCTQIAYLINKLVWSFLLFTYWNLIMEIFWSRQEC